MNTMAHVGGQQNEEGGTGSGFARAVTIVAGQYTHRYQSSVCLPGVRGRETETRKHGGERERQREREIGKQRQRDCQIVI